MNVTRAETQPDPAVGVAAQKLDVSVRSSGVALHTIERSTPVTATSPQHQVTSLPELQAVLSKEETQALSERFGSKRYNDRGDQVSPATAHRGRLIDLVG